MGTTVFVPLTDDLLYDYPERIVGPIIPFSQEARRARVMHVTKVSVKNELTDAEALKVSVTLRSTVAAGN